MFYFDSFTDFLAMGGRHTVYVWSAYGIALMIMVGMVIVPLHQGKAGRKNIQRQIRRDAAAQTEQSLGKSTAESAGRSQQSMENN